MGESYLYVGAYLVAFDGVFLLQLALSQSLIFLLKLLQLFGRDLKTTAKLIKSSFYCWLCLLGLIKISAHPSCSWAGGGERGNRELDKTVSGSQLLHHLPVSWEPSATSLCTNAAFLPSFHDRIKQQRSKVRVRCHVEKQTNGASGNNIHVMRHVTSKRSNSEHRCRAGAVLWLVLHGFYSLLLRLPLSALISAAHLRVVLRLSHETSLETGKTNQTSTRLAHKLYNVLL